jgi:ribonuclease D
VKGSNKLTRPAMAVLRELWHWREREAVGANKPPFFVLSHDLLMKLAQTAADQQNGQVEELLPRHLSERRRGGIKKAIEQGLAVPPPQQPSPIRNVTRRPNEAELRRFAELQTRRDKRAAELGIDPTLIAPRAMLSELAHSWEKASPSLMRWQRQLLS